MWDDSERPGATFNHTTIAQITLITLLLIPSNTFVLHCVMNIVASRGVSDGFRVAFSLFSCEMEFSIFYYNCRVNQEQERPYLTDRSCSIKRIFNTGIS